MLWYRHANDHFGVRDVMFDMVSSAAYVVPRWAYDEVVGSITLQRFDGAGASWLGDCVPSLLLVSRSLLVVLVCVVFGDSFASHLSDVGRVTIGVAVLGRSG